MTPSQHPPEERRPIGALLAPDILALLEEAPSQIAAETEEMHPADLADVAEAMPFDQVPVFLAALPKDRAADVLEYLRGRHTVVRKELFAQRREMLLWTSWSILLATVNVHVPAHLNEQARAAVEAYRDAMAGAPLRANLFEQAGS